MRDTTSNSKERAFRNPINTDFAAIERASKALQALSALSPQLIPHELINPLRPYKNTVGVCIVTRIGIERFADLYTHRQMLSLATFQRVIQSIKANKDDEEIMAAVFMLLHLALDRLVMQNSSLSRWNTARSTIEGLFSKQALQIVWDFVEANPIGFGPANWEGAISWIEKVIISNLDLTHQGIAVHSDASQCPLPDDSVDLVFTDPPYFAAVPYADLADVFYVWLKRGIGNSYPILFQEELAKKQSELIVTNSSTGPNGEVKNANFFSLGMTNALNRARALTKTSGVSCIVFADSSTTSWESMLSAVIDSGWIVVASWPIDTEMQNRTRAQNSASLQSSVFMLCRPRETSGGELSENIGDWRDVLRELPQRIHSWMPRLAAEGVVGADAIFACLGPALEIFSRYSTVEKASGEQVKLGEYLEHVWAAVSREALSLLFKDADAGGLEPDARLTAMWLWTLSTADDRRPTTDDGSDEGGDDEEESTNGKGGAKGGFSLEFDAARKIAQGLGANLDILRHIVEVKGETARLLGVGERTHYLFGKDEAQAPSNRRPKKNAQQLSMFAELEQTDHDAGWGDKSAPKPGATVLDRVHQAMILFAAGRAEAMKRFLVEEGAGNDARFWKLAQSLSALYPVATDEKRWVDGVLARKKGLGF